MSDDEELKEDLLELRSNRALEMQFESKILRSICAWLWLCFQDFVKLYQLCSLYLRQHTCASQDLTLVCQ